MILKAKIVAFSAVHAPRAAAQAQASPVTEKHRGRGLAEAKWCSARAVSAWCDERPKPQMSTTHAASALPALPALLPPHLPALGVLGRWPRRPQHATARSGAALRPSRGATTSRCGAPYTAPAITSMHHKTASRAPAPALRACVPSLTHRLTSLACAQMPQGRLTTRSSSRRHPSPPAAPFRPGRRPR